MEDERRTSWESFLKGFVAGGLIGAGLALLFAPKSGRELREDIKKKSVELTKDVELLYSDAKEKTADWWQARMKQAEQLKEEAEQKLQDAKAKAAEIIEEGKKWVAKFSGSGEEQVAMVDKKADKEKRK
ncbi:MAG: YtxH domain-containing protein [candidate division KSB1 bacterium]|nr:YtxH domain-containing protein [candidate division KSB1 bacterium]MDZ7318879.1 YtxH domain-containing protein [candidate division KSB1 bacterium]MDZ7342492.1 YtxH domain-containing protein [candidate division KSB1 bacterium]